MNALVFVAALSLAAQDAADRDRPLTASIDGRWNVLYAERGGRPMDLRERQLRITGNTLTLDQDSRLRTMRLEFGPNHTVFVFPVEEGRQDRDLAPTGRTIGARSPEAMRAIRHGVYMVSNEYLCISLDPPGAPGVGGDIEAARGPVSAAGTLGGATTGASPRTGTVSAAAPIGSGTAGTPSGTGGTGTGASTAGRTGSGAGTSTGGNIGAGTGTGSTSTGTTGTGAATPGRVGAGTRGTGGTGAGVEGAGSAGRPGSPGTGTTGTGVEITGPTGPGASGRRGTGTGGTISGSLARGPRGVGLPAGQVAPEGSAFMLILRRDDVRDRRDR